MNKRKVAAADFQSLAMWKSPSIKIINKIWKILSTVPVLTSSYLLLLEILQANSQLQLMSKTNYSSWFKSIKFKLKF